MSHPRRIGLLTGGGDCAGLNAVIRAVTKPAVLEHGIEVLGIEDGYLGLIEKRFRVLSDPIVSGILSRGGTILGTSNRADPFHYLVQARGQVQEQDRSQQVVENYKSLGLEALIVIGGDGTLKIAQQLMKLGLKIVGVPKTIDNDLCETDFTFGFDSAVSVATEALDRLHTTAESHHRVMILEVMGRYAGWISLFAGVAGGGDVILIPEIPFEIQKIKQKIEERCRSGKRFSIVVAAEGAFEEGRERVIARRVQGSPDPVRLGGIASQLSQQLENLTGLESRFTVLGHLQRGGSPTSFDRLLATRFGYEALNLVLAKDFGKMIALQGRSMRAVPIEKAVRRLKQVPLNHALIQAARGVGTSFAD